MGEKRQYGGEGHDDTWYGVSLLVQEWIIKALKEGKLSDADDVVVDTDDPTLAEKLLATPFTDADKAVSYKEDGTIVIPAAAYNQLGGRQPDNAKTMKSFDGGLQVYLGGFGPTAVQVLRGGSYKKGSNESRSAKRLRRSGYGEYEDWGFRVAVTPSGSNPPSELKLELGNGVSMELVYIKPGTFVMGSDKMDETKYTCVEGPKHKVTLTKGYYIGKYEVTQAQYSGNKDGDNHDYPVCRISKEDAENFCRRISEMSGQKVRLPTEAEWEYAARAGSNSLWFFGDDPASLGEYAWFSDNSGGTFHPVGQKKPNPWGLYDIYGNVWEGTSDLYQKDYYANSPQEDPVGWKQPPEYTMNYTVHVTRAGRYVLTMPVVTANYDQFLTIRVNGASVVQMIELPMTLGAWQMSPEAVVELKAGENTLAFLRQDPPQYGVAVKSFTLKPTR
jgi:formylglycine-generating enzyme required for sulfatase activity